jgi:hypothetical protein
MSVNLPRFEASYNLDCQNGVDTDTPSFVTADASSISIVAAADVDITISAVFTDSVLQIESTVALGLVSAGVPRNFILAIATGNYIGTECVIRATNASGGPGVLTTFGIIR